MVCGQISVLASNSLHNLGGQKQLCSCYHTRHLLQIHWDFFLDVWFGRDADYFKIQSTAIIIYSNSRIDLNVTLYFYDNLVIKKTFFQPFPIRSMPQLLRNRWATPQRTNPERKNPPKRPRLAVASWNLTEYPLMGHLAVANWKENSTKSPRISRPDWRLTKTMS